MPDPYNVAIDATYLRFNPSSGKFHEDICKDIPAFREYSKTAVHKPPMQVRIFAWIVVMYDMHTPLRREINDLYKRKVYAGTLVGLTPHKVTGKYREFVENIFTGQDAEVNDLIVKFIASFSSPEYTQLMAHVSIQHNLLNKIIKGSATKDNQTMFDTATATISKLTNLVYGTGERDEVYEARRALYKQVSYDLADMRAESVAKMVVDEGLPEGWNPYEAEYTPGQIKFVGDDDSIAEADEK